MVSIPFFKFVRCHSNVFLCYLVVCCCHLGFVDYIFVHAFPRDWTFVFIAAVTRVVGCVGGVFRGLSEDLVVMFVDQGFYIVHTAVAYFQGIAVENSVEFVGLRKMFVDQIQKKSPKVGGNVFAEGRIVPDDVAVSVALLARWLVVMIIGFIDFNPFTTGRHF